MRRNNFVFMWGRITQYTTQGDSGKVEMVNLWVETERNGVSGQHKVVVHSHQASELLCFLQAEERGLPDIAVQGWLCTLEENAIVVADRFTILTDHRIRQRAIEAMHTPDDAHTPAAKPRRISDPLNGGK